MSNTNQKAIDKLHHLISIANDGRYGYENAAEDVGDVILKQMFRQYSVEREKYADELRKEVAKLGGSPDKGSGPLGALHRTWMDIKSTLTSGNKEAILKACITGEEAAVIAYNDALQDEHITGSATQTITEQLGGIQFSLNSIRSLAATAEG